MTSKNEDVCYLRYLRQLRGKERAFRLYSRFLWVCFKRRAWHYRACPAGPSQITLCSWNIDPTIIFPWKDKQGKQDRPLSYKINTKSSCICLWIQCGGLVYNPEELHKKKIHFLSSSLGFPTSPPSSVKSWFDKAAALRPWSSGASFHKLVCWKHGH